MPLTTGKQIVVNLFSAYLFHQKKRPITCIMKSNLLIIKFLLCAFVLSGCLPENECEFTPNLSVDEAQLNTDIDRIKQYLTENEIEAQVHETGIRYVINEPGNGSTAELCDVVTVNYEGRLLSNGEIFDSSESPATFPLSGLITGWQIGIPLIQEGGSITLYIPSVYAYGRFGSGDDIPANANLIFDIELVEI